jgi:hypothetical protein
MFAIHVGVRMKFISLLLLVGCSHSKELYNYEGRCMNENGKLVCETQYSDGDNIRCLYKDEATRKDIFCRHYDEYGQPTDAPKHWQSTE